jgi:hypothetical protein
MLALSPGPLVQGRGSVRLRVRKKCTASSHSSVSTYANLLHECRDALLFLRACRSALRDRQRNASSDAAGVDPSASFHQRSWTLPVINSNPRIAQNGHFL